MTAADTPVGCPNCGHDDHEGVRCRGVTTEGEPCACSWPDPSNYADPTSISFQPGATITLHLRGTTVGPDDKVVINLPEAASEWAQELIRVANEVLGPNRVLVICADGATVTALAPAPPEVEPVCTCAAGNNGILEPPPEGCPVHGPRDA